MTKPKYQRETERVLKVHPGLDEDSARRVAEKYVEVARTGQTTFAHVLAESVRAEKSSEAGNDVSA